MDTSGYVQARHNVKESDSDWGVNMVYAAAKEPAVERVADTTFKFDGYLRDYLRGISKNWLEVAPLANPGMLEMFRDRDRQPYRDMLPWAGEFAGKYLTGAVQVLRLTADPQLKRFLEWFVAELVSLQAEDGYLGPWPRGFHLTNRAEYPDGKTMGTWDTWGHYHTMLGLMLWYEETGDEEALTCVQGMADLLCERYLGSKSPRLVETGYTEPNLAPIHSLCLLYEKTRVRRYLDMALQIVDELAAKDVEGKHLAGDYINIALAGKEFFQAPMPRWENLHTIMGLAELYYLTGEESYRRTFEHLWRSIAKLDRHNNGGFSSGELAQGNPYHQDAIETCCTIAWIAMSVEMLRMTGDALVADELEFSTINSVVGMHSHTGRWATYNTPMDGIRRASAPGGHGTPELNCCSVNSARGFGMISDWALMGDSQGLILNWYGPGVMRTHLPSDVPVVLKQETDYPRSGDILLHVMPAQETDFTLRLRIPRWSAKTVVKVNGEVVQETPAPGSYLALRRTWAPHDRVEISLDMSLHYWVGEKECAGKTSIYRGPVLLVYDRRFNDMDPDDVPTLDAGELHGRVVEWPGWIPPIVLVEFTATDGRTIRLCDFGSAGEAGTPYQSWLEVEHEGLILPQYFAEGSAAD